MRWHDIRLPETPQNLPQDFTALVVSKAKSLAPDLDCDEACETLRHFLEAEVSLLKQASQHHEQWPCVYHENVALAEAIEIKIYQNILEQLPSAT